MRALSRRDSAARDGASGCSVTVVLSGDLDIDITLVDPDRTSRQEAEAMHVLTDGCLLASPAYRTQP